MIRPYLVMVNNLIFDRKLTKAGALKVIARLQRERGLKAVLAYERSCGADTHMIGLRHD